MLTRISIDELQREGAHVTCVDDVAALIAGTDLVEMRPCVGGGFTAIPTRNIGAVRVGDLQIEVRPKEKVRVEQVMFLLGYAKDPGFRLNDVWASSEPDLLPALAETLARQARRALSGGLHHGYVSIDESARTMRGRIRIGDQLSKHPGISVPLEVTYDDFSPDVAENRILRTALRLVAAIPGVKPELRNELARLDARLDGVRTLVHGESLPYWAATRLNTRYHGVLRLAEIVLKYQSTKASNGSLEMAAFVVPMWKVFEDFVGAALAEALRYHPGRTIEQYRTTLDEYHDDASPVVMDVDIVHLVDGRPVIIADAKYKAASTSGQYPNADKYQMLAYCTALGIDRAWLVYAQGANSPQARRVRNTDIQIIEWSLDLSKRPTALLAQVDELARTMATGAALSETFARVR